MLGIAQESNQCDALDVTYSTDFSLWHSNYSVRRGSLSVVSTLLFILSHLITAFQLNTLKVLQIYI